MSLFQNFIKSNIALTPRRLHDSAALRVSGHTGPSQRLWPTPFKDGGLKNQSGTIDNYKDTVPHADSKSVLPCLCPACFCGFCALRWAWLLPTSQGAPGKVEVTWAFASAWENKHFFSMPRRETHKISPRFK